MSEVHQPPEGDQGTDPSTTKPATIRWDNPSNIRKWLGDLRDQVLDALAAGEDATRRPKRRFFSRYEAKRRLRHAEESILALIEAAERDLPPKELEQ
jgi:hypothetical protein